MQLRCRSYGRTLVSAFFLTDKETTDRLTKVEIETWTAWRMRILWNVFFCTVALQIYPPKRKLSGTKVDRSFQTSVWQSLCLRYFWHAQTLEHTFHQYLSAATQGYIEHLIYYWYIHCNEGKWRWNCWYTYIINLIILILSVWATHIFNTKPSYRQFYVSYYSTVILCKLQWLFSTRD